MDGLYKALLYTIYKFMKMNESAVVHRLVAPYHAHLRMMASTFLTLAETPGLTAGNLEFIAPFVDLLGGSLLRSRVEKDKSLYVFMCGEIPADLTSEHVSSALTGLARVILDYVEESEQRDLCSQPLFDR